MLVDLHAHFPMHLLPDQQARTHERLQTWSRQRWQGQVAGLASRFANYQGPGDTPGVTETLMRDGGVGVALSMLYQPFDEIDLTQSYGAPPRESYFKDIVDQRQTVEDYVAAHRGDVAIAHSVTELDALLGDGVPILIHAIEGGFQLGRDPAEVPRNVKTLADLGIAYVTIAHLFFRGVATNAPALPFLSDSVYNRVYPQAKDEGLTALGHEVVDAMIDEGILIDITHMRSQSIRDLMAQLDARDPAKEIPVMGTHMAYRFGGLQYSFDDETITAVAARGGVLGCILCEHFITSGLPSVSSSVEGSLEALCRHIDKIRELTGSYDHIAIGSDLDGYIKPALPGLDHMGRMADLQQALRTRYGVDEAQKICNANALRVLRADWGRKRPRIAIDPSTDASRIEIGTLGGASNDLVGEEDQLGFTDYVGALSDLITSPYTLPPLTIGLFGSWGMGKSFLLKHIEREIGRRQQAQDDGKRIKVGPRIHVLAFNAWEYNATDHVWPGLVRKILEKLDQDVPWPHYKRWWARLKWNVPRAVRRLRAPLIAAALVTGATLAASIWTNRTNLAAAIGLTAGGLSLAGLYTAAKNPIATWVTALLSDSDYGREISDMVQIKHDLETLEARLHRRGDRGAEITHRILVLIDDLDRCEPQKAVEVLQAVNLLLNFESFIVCLGIDARIVTGAIEKHYEGLLGRAGASGYEYLDKIVQIPFRIPEPSDDEIKRFIAKQLGSPSPNSPIPVAANPEPALPEIQPDTDQPPSDVDDDEESTESRARADPAGISRSAAAPSQAEPEAAVPFTYAELQAFDGLTPSLRHNPRHLKRLVNVYRLVRALARARGEELILRHPDITVYWLLIWSQWPYTAHAMLQRFDELDESEKDADVDPLLYLFDLVSSELDVDVRDRLDDHPEALRDLLAGGGDRLSWGDLRVMRRYTVNFNPAVEEQLRRGYQDATRSDQELHRGERTTGQKGQTPTGSEPRGNGLWSQLKRGLRYPKRQSSRGSTRS